MTAANVDTVQPGGCEQSMVADETQGLPSKRVVNTESGEDDYPSALMSQNLMSKEVKNVDPFRLSREGRHNPFPRPRFTDDCEWKFTEEMLRRVSEDIILSTEPEDFLQNRRKFHCIICGVNHPMRSD